MTTAIQSSFHYTTMFMALGCFSLADNSARAQ
jgi:hypothetical protein